MTPIAQPAINTLIQWADNNSPPNYNTVANVGDITGLGMSAAVVDVTSHSTSIPWREKITTLLDAGQLSFKLYFIPMDSGHKQLLSFFTTRTLVNWRITFPDQDATKYSFSAYVSKFTMSEPVAGVMEAAVTFDTVGQPNFAAS